MSSGKAKVVAVAALCALAAVGGFFFYGQIKGGADDAPLGPAPELSLPDLNGTPRALSEWRGKLLLVNFWATWCTPCLHEIPMLIAAQERHGGRGLQVIGPAMDDPEAVKNSAPQLGINYPVLVGDTAIVNAMDALGDTIGALPFSVLIGADGNILLRKHGEFSHDELEAVLAKHLPVASVSP